MIFQGIIAGGEGINAKIIRAGAFQLGGTANARRLTVLL